MAEVPEVRGPVWSERVADPARVYDALLGGKDHFAVDRWVADRVLAVEPLAGVAARDNREFVLRAVRYLASAGVEQFIDVGAGFPVEGRNVHEAAGSVASGARVVYVDRNPVVVAHANALVCPDAARFGAVCADMLDPAAVLGAETTRRLVDFSRPVGLLFGAMLHFVPDSAGPWGLVDEYLFDLAAGSYLVVSHAASAVDRVRSVYETSSPLVPRSYEQVCGFFAGLDLVEPGVVWTHEWRPVPVGPVGVVGAGWDLRRLVLGGVGRKPGLASRSTGFARRPSLRSSARSLSLIASDGRVGSGLGGAQG